MTEIETIYRLSLDLPRKNRALGLLHGTGLTLFESHVLTELEINPTLDSAGLAHLLALNQSSISRIIKKLSAQHYLTLRKSTEDSRKILIRVTAKAEAAVKKIDKAADSILEAFSKNISVQELEKLKAFLSRFSDGFSIPRAEARKGEHILRVEQRRIARWLKILNLGSSRSFLSPTEHHVLRLLSERQKALSPSSIAELLQIQTSALSVILKKMRAEEILAGHKDVVDKRVEYVALTAEGEKLLKQHEGFQLEGIRAALAGFSIAELRDFAQLFQRFLELPSESKREFAKRFSVKSLDSTEQRREARRCYLEELSDRRRLGDAPEFLFDHQSKSYGLFEKDRLVAAIQFRSGQEICFFSQLSEREFMFEQFFREACSK